MNVSGLNDPAAEPMVPTPRNHLLDAIPAGAAVLCRRWWAFALRGGVSVLFGLMALILPVPTVGSLLLVVAAYLLADGVLSIMAAARAAAHHARWGLLLVEGGLDLLLAAAILLAPIETVLAFVYLVATWAFVSGAVLLAAALGLSVLQGRVWLVLAGLASLLWGAGLFVWPAAGALMLTWWMAGYALLFGIVLIALSLQLRRGARAVPLSLW